LIVREQQAISTNATDRLKYVLIACLLSRYAEKKAFLTRSLFADPAFYRAAMQEIGWRKSAVSHKRQYEIIKNKTEGLTL